MADWFHDENISYDFYVIDIKVQRGNSHVGRVWIKSGYRNWRRCRFRKNLSLTLCGFLVRDYI